jgi:hypothetical protein
LRSALPIVLGDSRGGMRWDFFLDRVVPVGDRFLCWIKYSSGILLYDMAADPNLVLCHLPLPVTPWPREGRRYNLSYSDDEYEDESGCSIAGTRVQPEPAPPRCGS